MILLYLALGGALGTLARHGANQLLSGSSDGGFPWSTFAVNLVGSFILGVVIALADRSALSPELRLVLGVGFCGALTTFSTFSLEALGLMQAGYVGRAALYLAVSVACGLLAAVAGIRIGS